MSDKLVTVEYVQKQDTVEIHLDSNGLNALLKTLESLKNFSTSEHVHLFASDSGAEGLTNELQNRSGNAELINHLKIFLWKGKEA
jgi:hypothetical protein